MPATDEIPYCDVIAFIRSQFGGAARIGLHEPRFQGREIEYVTDCIHSTFVSSVGPYVDRFEARLAEVTGAAFAVATVNGTSALHAALKLAGVGLGDEVITQSLTFVATANAVSYCGAVPCFVDVECSTLGLSPDSLRAFLAKHTQRASDGVLINRATGRRISACVPMHTFGHPCRIDEIVRVCGEAGLPVIEDATESLGSRFREQHTGTFGAMGVFSFNGNKTVTCGGGGAIITDCPETARRAKHLTTTAKVPHRWEFDHDEIGFNYRMPNLNAALACAQLERLEAIVERKRALSSRYRDFFSGVNIDFFTEPAQAWSNYWLNALLLHGPEERAAFLEATNKAGIMTRPVWKPLHRLKMFRDAPRGPLPVTEMIAERLVNIPSSEPEVVA